MARGVNWLGLMAGVAMPLAVAGVALTPGGGGQAQAQDGGTITLRSDIQEANAATGIITARGNVQIDYPARRIQATSAQADYYSNEQRIVLSGNVLINQQGNTLRAEVVTYLIEEDRFVATPNPNEQVEAIYTLPATPSAAPEAAPSGGAPAPRPPVVLDVSPIDSTDSPDSPD
ncbi:MAG TPA: LptA/OstA family protein [Nodosilinea sp.]|nr:LptA/OstA family protein [Nodosilinea sp.]